MKYRLKNPEAQSFFDVYSNGEFTEKLNERIKWKHSLGYTFDSGFNVIIEFTTSFAIRVELLISSEQIELDEE